MLVDVGNRKLRVNWKHRPFKSKATLWLEEWAESGGQRFLEDKVMDDQLREILAIADRAERSAVKRLGTTVCIIQDENDALVASGTVECSLMEKSYKKEQGRKESLEKAISIFSRTERTEIWKQYHERMGKAVAKAA